MLRFLHFLSFIIVMWIRFDVLGVDDGRVVSRLLLEVGECQPVKQFLERGRPRGSSDSSSASVRSKDSGCSAATSSLRSSLLLGRT